jgi:hypothetical protein
VINIKSVTKIFLAHAMLYSKKCPYQKWDNTFLRNVVTRIGGGGGNNYIINVINRPPPPRRGGAPYFSEKCPYQKWGNLKFPSSKQYIGLTAFNP